jgi:hypothetical protein
MKISSIVEIQVPEALNQHENAKNQAFLDDDLRFHIKALKKLKMTNGSVLQGVSSGRG